jgi:L-threonylcarbamoyladenylate synthase
VIFAASDIVLAAARLREGGVVAFPTETVYGLGADAFNEASVRHVFELKGRPSNNPLIVHIADAAGARRCVQAWPAAAATLADAFWPGPLSIVLPKHASIPEIVTGGGPNVALRSPDHPLTLALLRAFGGPLVGPSANRSGSVSPTTAAHVRGVWPLADVLVLDGGPCRIGIESTVVSLAGAEPKVLRPGMITPHDIARVLGRGVTFEAPAPDGGPLDSPGRLVSHYAPAARALLVENTDVAAAARPGCVAIVIRCELPPDVTTLRLPDDAPAYAAALYDTLRRADGLSPPLIVIERPDDSQDQRWAAVLDRLSRACAPRVTG